MGINVAGTNALGDYLVSQIQNARILMGEPPNYSTTSGPPASTSKLPTKAQLQQELANSQIANAQILFGLPQVAPGSSNTGLPPIAGQTPHQIEAAGIQESVIEQQFVNTATLFNSIGFGANVNTSA